MDKTIDFNRTVYDLYKDYPEILDIMKDIGFKEIGNAGMINTAGRFMTISKGAKMKGIDTEEIKKAFEAKGFAVLV